MELVRIEQKCEQFWFDTLATSNCVELFLAADKYSIAELRRKSLELVYENIEKIACEKFDELKVSYLTELLACETIHAKEELFFQRLVSWVSYDEEYRSKYVPGLLKLIQLEKIRKPVC